MRDFVRVILRISSVAQKSVDLGEFASSPTLVAVARNQVRSASHTSVVLLYRSMPRRTLPWTKHIPLLFIRIELRGSSGKRCHCKPHQAVRRVRGESCSRPIGLPTVGFGHLCQMTNCAEVPFAFPLTQAEATTLLNSDLKTPENCITNDISSSVRLNDNQYGALVSWAFNVGCGNAPSSTLISRLNGGQDPNTVAAQELPKRDMAGGMVLQGLVNRRAAELTLFQTASSVIAHPAC